MTKETRQTAHKKPLEGKTILITRAEHQALEFGELIRNAGGTPVFLPTIEVVPPASWDECDRAARSLDQYDGLIFTSANGVEFFFDRLHKLHLFADSVKSLATYAVGPRTRSSLERYGLAVTPIPEQYTAEQLSHVMANANLQDRKFLFPRGNLSRDDLAGFLRSCGASVDAITVYQTGMPRSESNDRAQDLVRRGNVDVATFTSPSTVQNFIEMFSTEEVRNFHRKTKFAVIGPTTHSALRTVGFEADIVARKSTVSGLLESIIHDLTSALRPPASEL